MTEIELPPGARLEDGFIVVGQEAWFPEEWRKRVEWETAGKARQQRPDVKAKRRVAHLRARQNGGAK